MQISEASSTGGFDPAPGFSRPLLSTAIRFTAVGTVATAGNPRALPPHYARENLIWMLRRRCLKNVKDLHAETTFSKPSMQITWKSGCLSTYYHVLPCYATDI